MNRNRISKHHVARLVWFLVLVFAGFAVHRVRAQEVADSPKPAARSTSQSTPAEMAAPQTPAVRPRAAAEAPQEPSPRTPIREKAPRARRAPELPDGDLLDRVEQEVETLKLRMPRPMPIIDSIDLPDEEMLERIAQEVDAVKLRFPRAAPPVSMLDAADLLDTESLGAIELRAPRIASMVADQLDAGTFKLAAEQAQAAVKERIAPFAESDVWKAERLASLAAESPRWRRAGHADTPEEELKIAALQSLFRADADRGAVVAGDMLKADSKATRNVKEAAISLLGQYRAQQSITLLEELARNQSDPELRRAALRWLAERGGPQSVPVLIRLYDTEKDTDTRQGIVHWLGRRPEPEANQKVMDIARRDPAPELRQAAISSISNRSSSDPTATLIQLYDSEQNLQVKQAILHALFNRAGKRGEDQQGPNPAFDKLMQVAKTDSSVELRQSALHWVGERSTAEALIQLYDSERSVELKQGILHSLYNLAGRQSAGQAAQNAALDKLMQIAKSDPSMELRTSAIHWVGERSGAEVVISLYDSQTNPEVKQSLLHSLAQKQSDAAIKKLGDVARTDPSTELRQTAIHLIAQRRGGEGVDTLIQLYDGEKNAEIKVSILHSLGQQAARPAAPEPSPQKRALHKLFDVAKKDPSVELRTQAVHAIGQSKDPEAVKFIEDLLK
jgi:HEAT repeat protein